MTNWQDYFRGKKVTVMGLGLLGRGVGDVKFLAEAGADLIVTDLKSEEELAASLKALQPFGHIRYVLGEHRLEDFRNRDFVLKAAGVPLDSPFIAEARQNKIPVVMSTALLVKLLPPKVTVIGVTGTRGKSTVTQLIYEILETAFPRFRSGQKNPRIFLGGNVRGVSTLALLPEIQAGDIVVLELDSWQLQGFGDLQISPQIAVFTNLLPDHLNYYGGSTEKYAADKANIFKFQKPGDYLVRGEDVNLPTDWQLRIPGEHNRQNAALAKKVAEILQIQPELIKKVITSFVGVPGRLELIRELNGVKIYNDTTSTTPDALKAALLALGSELKNLILIAGGADKNLDFSEVLPLIKKFCKAVILLPGTGTDRINLTGSKVETLAEAVAEARKFAGAGEIILFSPGFASFGLFKNEFDRGDQFNSLVEKLN